MGYDSKIKKQQFTLRNKYAPMSQIPISLSYMATRIRTNRKRLNSRTSDIRKTKGYLFECFPCIWEIPPLRQFFLLAKLTVRPHVPQSPFQLGETRIEKMLATSRPAYMSSYAWSCSFTHWHEADQQNGLKSQKLKMEKPQAGISLDTLITVLCI